MRLNGTALSSDEESTAELHTHYAASSKTETMRETETFESSTSHLLSDADRLRMLGYDEVLDRPYSFWGLFCMNIFHESILYEFMLATSLYAYNAPLLFIIGYPVQALLHLCLLGTFSELASAFPVAGATATWAWRCARAGVRHERQWGWLVSGLVLASHIGRNLAALYNGSIGVTSIYKTMAFGVQGTFGPSPAWCNPVFYVSMVTLAAVVIFSRVGRSNLFWIISASIYGLYLVAAIVLICYGGYKSHQRIAAANLKSQLDIVGLKRGAKWKYSDGLMIFTGIPMKMVAIDCPAHMAEETRNPARTVPRVMIASTLTHFVVVYIMVMAYIFCLVPEYGNVGSMTSPFMPIVQALKLNMDAMYALGIIGIVVGNLMTTSSVLVMTRFMFSLARDYAIPFGSTLLRMSRGKEPWLADITIFLALYASVSAYWVSAKNYYTLAITFGYFFLAFPYTIVLILYVFSDLQPGQIDRSQFSLGRWSKPVAWVSLIWGIVVLIQGCFPGHFWTVQTIPLSPNSMSFLPFVLVGMVVVMTISWFLYGRRHYIGPIRALTRWIAGVEIDPNDYTTSAGRGAAIRTYVRAQTGAAPNHGNFLKRIFGSRSNVSRATPHPTPETSNEREQEQERARGPRQRIVSLQSKDSRAALPESQVLPATRGSRIANFFGGRSHSHSPQTTRSESIRLGDISGGERVDAKGPSHAMPESQLEPARTLDPNIMSHAIPESQLEPARTNIMSQAILESQLEPARPIDPYIRSYAIPESQLEPTRTFHELHIMSHAMAESQLEPLASDPHLMSHAMAESQLEPTRTNW